MKKIKIMLAAIAVLAIAGGGLAFKAKNAFRGNLWTSTQSGNGCVNIVNSNTGGTSGPEYYYTDVSPLFGNGVCITTSTTLVYDL
jgi:hypothetical protein